MYFENLTVKWNILYVLNTYVKFHVNNILFTILSTNLFYIYIYIYIILDYKNLKFKHLIDNIIIYF